MKKYTEKQISRSASAIRLFLFGTISIFIFTSLSSTKRLNAIDSRIDEWKTIAGEPRNPYQAESLLHQVLDKSGVTALSVAVVQGPAVVFLDQNIGIVIQSVITRPGGIAPLIAKDLIGDIYSPFSWLLYQASH